MSEPDGRWRSEISPDGRTRLDIAIGDGLMSHEIWSPRITDIASGNVILDLIDQDSWDGEVRWLDKGDFTISIRNYIAGGGVRLYVRVYRADQTFAFGEPPGPREPLADLPGRVPEAFRREAMRIDPSRQT